MKIEQHLDYDYRQKEEYEDKVISIKLAIIDQDGLVATISYIEKV